MLCPGINIGKQNMKSLLARFWTEFQYLTHYQQRSGRKWASCNLNATDVEIQSLMWSNFRALHAALAVSCLHIVPWFSSARLNNTKQFTNAGEGFVFFRCVWVCVSVCARVCVCVCVLLSARRHNDKSEQLSFLLSPGRSLLTCNLYWITLTLIF